jgi:hypothetical protein
MIANVVAENEYRDDGHEKTGHQEKRALGHAFNIASSVITIVAAKERKRCRGAAAKAAPVVPEWRRHELAALALCCMPDVGYPAGMFA